MITYQFKYYFGDKIFYGEQFENNSYNEKNITAAATDMAKRIESCSSCLLKLNDGGFLVVPSSAKQNLVMRIEVKI